jgi:hypothetical protein
MLDPQRINLYVYVRNTPLQYFDPNGRDLELASDLDKGDRERIIKQLVKHYRKKTFREAIERMEKSEVTHTIGGGKLGTVGWPTSGQVEDNYGRNQLELRGKRDESGKVTEVDRSGTTNTITIDFQKRDDAQGAYENGMGSEPPSESDVIIHEVGHGNDFELDPVKVSNTDPKDLEPGASDFTERVRKEKNSLSEKEAKKRIYEILGLEPPK